MDMYHLSASDVDQNKRKWLHTTIHKLIDKLTQLEYSRQNSPAHQNLCNDLRDSSYSGSQHSGDQARRSTKLVIVD